MGKYEKTYELHGVRCKHATDKAILIECDDLDEEEWIPLSQVSEDSEVMDTDDEGTLIITLWLAEQKGWA